MKKALENDLHFKKRIPVLAVQQGMAHATRLPYKRKELPIIENNFKKVIKDGNVEIWYLNSPCVAGAAIFLSPIIRNGQKGYQVEDIIVRKCLRGIGIGEKMLLFAAALAKENNFKFLAWECEDTNPAQIVYRKVEAKLNNDITAIRLNKATLTNSLNNLHLTDLPDNSSCSVSRRFSLFRTMCYTIPGYDINAEESYSGLQIDDLDISSTASAINMLLAKFNNYDAKGLNFVDLIVSKHKQVHLELVKYFDAGINTYSGSPVTLWELKNDEFEMAAEKGKAIHKVK